MNDNNCIDKNAEFQIKNCNNFETFDVNKKLLSLDDEIWEKAEEITFGFAADSITVTHPSGASICIENYSQGFTIKPRR